MASAFRRVAGRRHSRKVHQPVDNLPNTPKSFAFTQGSPPGMQVGHTHVLQVHVTAQDDTVLLVPFVATSSDTGVVTVRVTSQTTALTTAIGAGSATVTGHPAGFPNLEATVNYTVSASPTADAVVVLTTDPTILNGQSVTLVAEVRDGGGVPLSGQTVSWVSGTPSIVTVTADDATNDPQHQTTATAHASNIGASVITVSSGGATPDTATVTVAAPPSGDFPNLPSGMTLVSDVTFDDVSKLPPTASYDQNTRWRRPSGAGRLTIGSAASLGFPTPPYGDTVLRGLFPQNFNNGSGTAPFVMEMQFFASGGTVKKRVYYKVWMCYDPNWVNAVGCDGAKLGFWLPTSAGVVKHHLNAAIVTPAGPGGVPPRGGPPVENLWKFDCQTSGSPKDPNNHWSFSSSLGDLGVGIGVWRQVEILVDVGTAGNNDGLIKLWQDGTLIHNRTRVVTPAGAPTPGCRGITWHQTVCGFNHPQNSYVCVARWAVFHGD